MDVMEHEKIIGWHGTTRESSEKIMQAGFRFEEYIFGKSTQRLPNDLGAGIYFFVEDDHLENPQSLAYKYVLNYKNRELNKTKSIPKVLKAEINVNEDFVLDFDEMDNTEALMSLQKLFRKELYQEIQRLKPSGAVDRGNFDGLFIELLIAKFKKDRGVDIDIVRKRTFTNVEEKLGNIPIRRSNFPNGKEISVRKSELITNLE